MEQQVLGGSFRIGRVWGVEVKLHFLFVLLAAFFLLTAHDTAAAALSMGVLFGSVFLHELGHCFGARAVGGEAHEIVLWPLGGFTRMRIPRTAKGEFVSTAAGPAVNFGLFGLGVIGIVAIGTSLPLEQTLELALGARGAELHEVFLYQVAGINLILFLFNVIPAYPMDGGRLLRSMLWPVLGWRTATLIASATAVVFGVGFGLLGILGRDLFFVLIAAFVVMLSVKEFQRAYAFRPLPPVPDDDLMPYERRR